MNCVSPCAPNAPSGTPSVNESTPNATTIPNTAGLSAKAGEGWNIAYGTSWHFGLEFTSEGPKALGLVSYSQSANSASPYFSDQMRRYSEKNMRAIPFTEEEIKAALVQGGETTVRLN